MHVVVQVGQCGNQLGKQFFDTVAETVTSNKSPRFFSEEIKDKFFSENSTSELRARAVLVDAEPKVIAETVHVSTEHPFYQYQETGSFFKNEGSGNNWAMGYLEHGPMSRDTIRNLLRKEAERCDYIESFLVFMSVAGGTGSGIGTWITELLKKDFPSVPIVNQVIWPFQKGEVTVQSYNALFTLSHLQNCSDAVILSENDQLYKVCSQRMGMKAISLSNLNVIASQQLACLLFPSKLPSGFPSLFGDILAHLVPHPQFKIVNLRTVPQDPPSYCSYSTHAWKTLLRSLRRMLLYNSMTEECAPVSGQSGKTSIDTPISLSNLLLLRGNESSSADAELLHKPSLPYASWVPPTARLKTWIHPTPLYNQQRSATLANNGQVTVPCVDKAVAKSWKMYHNKAYVHHYKAFGLQDEDFMSSFSTVEQLLASYKALSAG